MTVALSLRSGRCLCPEPRRFFTVRYEGGVRHVKDGNTVFLPYGEWIVCYRCRKAVNASRENPGYTDWQRIYVVPETKHAVGRA